MATQAERRARLRSTLILIILATLPFYCIGFILLQVRQVTGGATHTPSPTVEMTATDTVTPLPALATTQPAVTTATQTLTPTITWTPSPTYTLFVTPTRTATITPSPQPTSTDTQQPTITETSAPPDPGNVTALP